MSDYIYILYDYGEDGPDRMLVTTDRSQLMEMAQSFDEDGWFARVSWDPIQRLRDLLSQSDEQLVADRDGDHGLMEGWGGLCLRIVRNHAAKDRYRLDAEQMKEMLLAWQNWWNCIGFQWYVDGEFRQREKPPFLRDGNRMFQKWIAEECRQLEANPVSKPLTQAEMDE